VELSAILLARVIAFVEVADLNPPGGLFFPELTKELVQRFNFQQHPRTVEEWTNEKGSIFAFGKLGNVAVDKLILFNNGIQVDTHSGTIESKEILEDTLAWARDKFGCKYKPELLRRWAYVSGLTFTSDEAILSSPALDNLAVRTSHALSEIAGEPMEYVPMIQTIGHDPLAKKFGRASFTIQRRLDVPFSDKKYYSEAPVPTEMHISLLELFETDVKTGKK
jgi:hypothetical protein